MTRSRAILPAKKMLAVVLAGGIVFAAACTATKPRTSPVPASPAAASARSDAGDWRVRQGLYFKRNWGVELINVTPVSSGYMLALRYRVLDPDRAKVINDRKSKAYLIDEATGTVLAVPAMENIGELRPGATPEPGRNYFMIFGNPGQLVKKGSRVSFRVGNLRATGLVVE
jgi:hypothetical protein